VLREIIEAGKLTPVIGKTYLLSEVPEAIRHLEDGHGQRKVAITRVRRGPPLGKHGISRRRPEATAPYGQEMWKSVCCSDP
jgi:hypothetical protein